MDGDGNTYLLIGEGGGITGAYTEYILYPNGRVETWNELEKESIYKGEIEKKQAKKVFEEWQAISDTITPVYKPGNMNYRIGYYNDGEVQTMEWSDNQPVEEPLLEFYSRTFQILRRAE